MSCSSVSRSTIFPLASSPHCKPTTEVADTKLPRLDPTDARRATARPAIGRDPAPGKALSEQEHAAAPTAREPDQSTSFIGVPGAAPVPIPIRRIAYFARRLLLWTAVEPPIWDRFRSRLSPCTRIE